MPIIGTINSAISGRLYTALAAFNSIDTISPTGTSATFSSIPATFSHLKIIGLQQSNYTAYNITSGLQFNGDNTSSYYRSSWYNLGDGVGNQYAYKDGSSSMNLGAQITAGSYYAPSGWLSYEIDIPNYTATDMYKSAHGTFVNGPLGISVSQMVLGSGVWKNTNAITSITITLSSGSFVSGSRLNLYGIL